MAHETAIADKLREWADEIENKTEWDNPWDWSWDHRCVDENSGMSDFDIGVDEDGDIIIHHDGYVATVSHEPFHDLLSDQ